MQELGVPAVLQDGRMGHFDGSVQARYSHITPAMRRQFLAQMAELWGAALDARLAMALHSPVAVLDRLLEARRKEVGE
jgi:hypothetical protein